MGGERLRGITFAKQFPNPVEPHRGLFVADQVRATREQVEWRVIAPIPYVPRSLASRLDRPYVRGDDVFDGDVPVARPRYPVLPGRRLYTTVAPLVAAAARAPFARAVREIAPQFVHAHALYPSAAAARRLAARFGLPLVVTIHGSDLYTNLVRPAWREELRAVARDASAVVCVSRRLAEDAIAEIGADPATTLVIPDAYDAATFGPQERPARTGGEAVRLVTVGRLVPEKGHAVLLDAMALLRDAGLDATLEICGDGAEASALRGQIERLRLADRVSLPGAQSRAELLASLARAELFVLPSLREGFGVALVEGMATGLPVVATRSGGPEDIIGATDGVLVDAGDPEALAEGIRAAVARLGEFDAAAIAADVARRYSPPAVGDALVALYRRVVAGDVERAGEAGLR